MKDPDHFQTWNSNKKTCYTCPIGPKDRPDVSFQTWPDFVCRFRIGPAQWTQKPSSYQPWNSPDPTKKLPRLPFLLFLLHTCSCGKLVHHRAKWAIFHSYVKLPEGSKGYIYIKLYCIILYIYSSNFGVAHLHIDCWKRHFHSKKPLRFTLNHQKRDWTVEQVELDTWGRLKIMWKPHRVPHSISWLIIVIPSTWPHWVLPPISSPAGRSTGLMARLCLSRALRPGRKLVEHSERSSTSPALAYDDVNMLTHYFLSRTTSPCLLISKPTLTDDTYLYYIILLHL